MLQVNFIRQNVELVKERLAVKNFKQIQLVDEILSLDENRKKLKTRLD
jgi:seryl-tRNA synthetase